MSNPLVDRILNNPLTFVAAKNPEKEVQTTRSSAYIVLNSSLAPASLAPTMATKKHAKREDKRPKSMAEAIAAYTGRKYLTKAEKKRKVRADTRPLPDPESSSDEKYESASEFHLDSSFQGLQEGTGESSAADDVGEDFGEDVGENLGDDSIGNMGQAADEVARGDSLQLSESPTSSSSEVESSSSTGESVDSAPHLTQDLENSAAALKQKIETESEEEDGDFEGVESGLESDSGSGLGDELGSQVASDEDADSDFEKKPHQPQERQQADSPIQQGNPQNGAQYEKQEQNIKKDLLLEKEQAVSSGGPVIKTLAPSSHYIIGEQGESVLSGRIMSRWTPPYKSTKPLGLLNFGVTCYMNSAIQIMVHIPAVQHYLAEVLQGKHKSIPTKSVTHTFAELALRMWGVGTKKSGPRKHVNPKRMVQRLDDINCMMSEWQQEDSHEYFMSLMSRLQEDSTPKGTKLNQLVMYDIFGGLLDQEVVCQACRTSSVTKQEFYDLSLGLNKKRTRSNDGIDTPADDHKLAGNKYTIEKSICDFFGTETIRVDRADASSGYFCECCQKRTVATKRSSIESSPHTLMVHLKRFKFNGNASLKVKQPIHYLKFLDMGPYSQTKENIKYQLMGVIVHEGRSILSGHYVAHCLQPDNSWATYDDEYINTIDETSALSDPSAYCLVYTRLEEKARKRPQTVGGSSKRARTA